MKPNLDKPGVPKYSELAKQLKSDTQYEHYSGKRYKIINIARHTETLEEVIIYQALYGDLNFWVRPLEMFCGDVEISGQIVQRFKCLENI